jgi:hypothetical protein
VAKKLREYRLVRKTTYNEYTKVFATSLAAAKRMGFPRHRVHIKTTRWAVVGEPKDLP